MQLVLALALLVSSLALVQCGDGHKRVRLVLPANLTVTCPSAFRSSPRLTLWYYPNGSLVETRDRAVVSYDTGVLFIQDLINDDCGLYYCTSLETGKGSLIAAGLSFVEVYTVESKPYGERAFIGMVAALCVLVTSVFVALIIKFRYQAENEKKMALSVISTSDQGRDAPESATSF